MKTRYTFALLLLLCGPAALAAAAQTPTPLTLQSLPQLQQQQQGHRHAIIYWSLSCVPCRQELTELGQTAAAKGSPISLVNTDGAAQQQAVEAFLAQQHLASFDNWQFAAAIPARLRAAIDPNWYGALPRSYAITAQGKRYPHAGRVKIAQLLQWLKGG